MDNVNIRIANNNHRRLHIAKTSVNTQRSSPWKGAGPAGEAGLSWADSTLRHQGKTWVVSRASSQDPGLGGVQDMAKVPGFRVKLPSLWVLRKTAAGEVVTASSIH